jgi:hypothetical protein
MTDANANDPKVYGSLYSCSRYGGFGSTDQQCETTQEGAVAGKHTDRYISLYRVHRIRRRAGVHEAELQSTAHANHLSGTDSGCQLLTVVEIGFSNAEYTSSRFLAQQQPKTLDQDKVRG